MQPIGGQILQCAINDEKEIHQHLEYKTAKWIDQQGFVLGTVLGGCGLIEGCYNLQLNLDKNKMDQVCKLVMLVDDDMTDNFITGRIISITGFSNDIVVKSTVREALMYLRENQTNGDRIPELIFLDLNMPLYNGFDFLMEFEKLDHRTKENCKIIILSSSDNKPDIEHILSIDHVIKFITKPISEQTLEEIHFKRA